MSSGRQVSLSNACSSDSSTTRRKGFSNWKQLKTSLQSVSRPTEMVCLTQRQCKSWRCSRIWSITRASLKALRGRKLSGHSIPSRQVLQRANRCSIPQLNNQSVRSNPIGSWISYHRTCLTNARRWSSEKRWSQYSLWKAMVELVPQLLLLMYKIMASTCLQVHSSAVSTRIWKHLQQLKKTFHKF